MAVPRQREYMREWKKRRFEAGYCRACGANKRVPPARYCTICMERNRWNERKRKYGISKEEYDALSVAQNHKCAICNQPEKQMTYGKVKTLAVDHDSKTGVIRGLLCTECNVAIGHLKHDPGLLSAAITYLTKGVAA